MCSPVKVREMPEASSRGMLEKGQYAHTTDTVLSELVTGGSGDQAEGLNSHPSCANTASKRGKRKGFTGLSGHNVSVQFAP